jgi:hypothetical protein
MVQRAANMTRFMAEGVILIPVQVKDLHVIIPFIPEQKLPTPHLEYVNILLVGTSDGGVLPLVSGTSHKVLNITSW